MICCVKCFKDIEARAIIEGLNKKGNCQTCESKNVYIYNTDVDTSLINLFDGLLDIYTPKERLPNDFPKEKLNLLKEELYSNWDIFNIEKDKIYTLITNICKEKYFDHPEIFDTPLGIEEVIQEHYLIENSLLKTYSWEGFVKAIKEENRFHTNYVNTKVLNTFCEYSTKSYKKGTIFFRSRISNKSGFKPSEMGAPPSGASTSGRANPSGISCLYLSDNKETTLHEIRAGAYDYVTIGAFVLKEDIDVINLASIDKISPFLTPKIDFTQHAINKEHLRKISNEIARPLRGQGSQLDYLPTQYISDFIKSKGYKGIEYKSTLYKDGYNIAIFDNKLFKCKRVSVYDITDLRLGYCVVDCL